MSKIKDAPILASPAVRTPPQLNRKPIMQHNPLNVTRKQSWDQRPKTKIYGTVNPMDKYNTNNVNEKMTG